MADLAAAIVQDEARFRRMVEAAPHAMVLVDQQGLIVTVNAQAEAAFGYHRDAMLGQPIELLIPLPARDQHVGLRQGVFATPIRRAMAAGRDLYARRQDGSVFAAEISLCPIECPAGINILAVIADITERKRVAASLHDALLLQAAIVASSNDAIISQTAEGVITSWNHGAERIFGFTAQEALGHTIAGLIAPAEYADEEHGKLAEVTRTGAVTSFETWRRRKDGSIVEVAVTLAPIHDDDRRLVGYSAVKRDLSAQRRGEARLRMVVEAAPAAIVMVNRDGIIEMVNAHAERMFDYARGALLGRRAELLLPGSFSDTQPFDPSAFFRAESDRDAQLRARRRDGTLIPVEAGVRPIETEDGPMLLAVISDISERVMAGQRLATHRAELQRSNEELATFAYAASHDLKSPLRAIFQLASWIDQDVQETKFDALPGYVKLLHRRLRRMENLLDDLLAYARVGNTRGGISEVSVAELAANIYETEMPPTAIRLDLDPGLPRFSTRAAPFAQVLRNLFSNAIKHHDRDQGTIRLTGRAAGEGWFEFTVADDGPGIPPKYHDKVFGMFQTLRPRDEVEGSGMGLALVKKIVEGFGGSIRIGPQQGRGCAMIFTWPSNSGGTLVNDSSANA